jgi:acetyltransferase
MKGTHTFTGLTDAFEVRLTRPDDEPALRRMLEASAPDDVRLRFFRRVRRFPHEFIEAMSRNDDARHLALVATPADRAGEIVASAMLVTEPDGAAAEFGIIVAQVAAGQRLGTHLLDCLADHARERGVRALYGLILAENGRMIDLARRLGFTVRADRDEPGCVRATLAIDLHQCAAAPSGAG